MPRPLLRLAAALAALLGAAGPAAAQTFYSPFGTNWNNYWNWQGGGTPPAGSTLTFGLYDGLGYGTTNDLGLTFGGLTFAPAAAGGASSGTLSIAGPLTLGGAQSVLTNNSQGAVTVSGTVGLTGGTAVAINGAGTGTLTLSNVISESGGASGLAVNTNPLGLTELSAANTFSGGVTLTQGNLQLGDAASLGTGTLTVAGGNSLLLAPNATVLNPIALGANTLNVGGVGAAAPTFGGPVTGTGGVAVRSGLVILSNAGNTYSGPTQVLGGSLAVTGPVASGSGVFGTATSAIQLGNTSGGGGRGTAGPQAASGLANAAELVLSTTGTTSFDRPVTVPAGTSPFQVGVYDSNGQPTAFTQTVTLAGPNSRLGVDQSNAGAPITFAGRVTGPGSLQFTLNGGTLTNATNDYSGGTVLSSGTLSVAAGGALGAGPLVVTAVNGPVGLAATSAAGLTVTSPVVLGGGGFAITSANTANPSVNSFALGTTTTANGTAPITFTQPLTGTAAVSPVATGVTLGGTATTENVIGFLTGGTAGNTVTAPGPLSLYSVDIPGLTAPLSAAPDVTAGGLAKYGPNFAQGLNGSVALGTGQLTVLGGGVTFASAGGGTSGRLASAGSVLVGAAGTNTTAGLSPAALTLDYTNAAGVDRLPDGTPIALHGGTLALTSTSTTAAAVSETVGALTTGGYGLVTVTVPTPTTGTTTIALTAASAGRTAGQPGTLLVRGTNLAGTTGNAAAVRFTTAPAGNASGVVPWIISDTTGPAGPGNTFTTYDPANGVTPIPLAAYSANSFLTPLSRFTATPAAPVAAPGTAVDALVVDSAAAGTNLAGTGTLTVGSGTISTAGVLFSGTGLGRLSGFTALDFGGREGIVYAATGPAQLTSPVTSTGGLTKGGAGTLFLSAASPGLSGTVGIGGGAVYVTDDGQLGAAGNPVVVNGGSLVWATGGPFTRTLTVGDGGGAFTAVAGSSVTLSGVTGNGAFIKAGTGTVTLTGTGNTYAGRTAIAAGVLVAGNESALGAAGTPIVFENAAGGGGFGATLRFTGDALTKRVAVLGHAVLDIPNATAFSGQLLGGNSSTTAGTPANTAVGLTKIGAGTLTVTGTQPFAGPVAVVEGGLTLGSSGGLPATFGTPLLVSATPTAASSGTYVANGATLTLDNTGTNLPDRLNDLQGLRLHNGNFRFLGNASADSTELLNMLLLQSGSVNTVTLVPGAGRNATVGFGGVSPVDGPSTISASAPSALVLFRGDGLGQAASAGTTTSTVVFQERDNQAASGGTTYPSVISPTALNGGGQLVGGGGGPGSTNISILPYAVGDTSSTGTGTTFVTYDGSLTGNVGIRPLTAAEYAASVGSRPSTFTPSTTNARLTAATALTGPASVNSLNLAGGAVTGSGQALTVTSGAVLSNSSVAGGGLTASVVTTSAAPFYFWVNDTLTVSSSLVSGGFSAATVPTYGLVKGGPGTLVLGGSNVIGGNAVNVGGSVSVGQGTLRVTSPSAVAPTALVQVLPGGTFDVATPTLTVGGLVGQLVSGAASPNPYNGGTVSLPANGTLGVGWQPTATTFSGSITGAGGVVWSSPLATTSVSTLYGSSPYTGPTTVVNGGFQLVGPAAGLTGTSSVNVAGGILTLSQADVNGFGGIATRVPATAPFALAGTLNVTGNLNAPTTTTLGQTTAGFNFQGGGTITATGGTNSTTALQLGLPTSNLLNRTNAATALVRGSNLGTLPLGNVAPTPVTAGTGPGVANLTFVTPSGTAATLDPANFVGSTISTPGSTGLRIIPWLVGDTSAAGTGTAFITADAGGLRPLNLNPALGAVEAATTFGTATDNVLNSSGSLAVGTNPTANSLTVSGTGTGLTGTGTLTLGSGGLLSTSTSASAGTAAATVVAFGSAEGLIHVTAANTFTVNGTLTGTGGLTKGGTGTLVLGAANPGLLGTVTISNGTVSIGSVGDAALGAPDNRLVFAGPFGSPTLNLTAAVPTLSRNVLLAGGSGTIGVSTGTTLLNGTISGPTAGSGVVGGSLIKTLGGQLTLADTVNTYGGYGAFTRVDNGILQFTRDSNLGAAGTDVVLNGGTLQLGGAWTTSRNLFVGASSTLALNGNNATLAGNVGGATTGNTPSVLTITTAAGTPATLTLAGTNTANTSLAVGANVTAVASSSTGLGQANAGTLVTVASGASLRLDGSTASGPVYNPVKAIQIAGTGVGGAGALQAVGTASTGGAVILTANAQITTPAAADRLNVYSTLSGNFTLTKTGAGTLNLAAPAGNGTVGAVAVSGGTLLVNNLVGTGVANTVTVANGATLGGNGSVQNLTTAAGAIVSPGNSVGTLTVSGTAAPTLASGTVFVMELNSATGAGGTNWDLLRVPNNAGSAIALGTGTIRLVTLDAGGNPGAMANFSSGQSYTWDYLHSSGGFSGFDPANFTVDTSGFVNSTGGGIFSTTLSNADTLVVVFTPVPEPVAVLGLAAAGLAAAGAVRRRRV